MYEYGIILKVKLYVMCSGCIIKTYDISKDQGHNSGWDVG